MSLRTSANRYAKALFDVALDEKADLNQVGQDLNLLASVVNGNRDLMPTVNRSGITEAERMAIADKVSAAMTLTAPVKKLFVLLAQNRRLELMPDLATAFGERLLAHQNIVRAEVTSAAPLSPEKIAALEDSLAKVTGKKVELSVSIDPELLGGVVARIGSTVYDGSVKTQLQRMRQELADK